MSYTIAQDYIDEAIRKLGVIDKAATPEATDRAWGLIYLEQLLARWSFNEQLNPYVQETISVGLASHTWGVSGSIATACPLKIDSARYKKNGYEYNLPVKTREDWEEITDKSQEGEPYLLYFDPTTPLGTLYVYPVFTGTIVCAVQKPFPVPTTQTFTMSLRPALQPAVVYHLAIEMAPIYEMEPPQTIVQMARLTLDDAMSMHKPRRGLMKRHGL
jgi:hypothetical protein